MHPPNRVHLLSPDNETFSTPPTTPASFQQFADPLPHRPSISRRNSRPTSLNTSHSQTEFKSDIELELTSPDRIVTPLSLSPPPAPPLMTQDETMTAKKLTPTTATLQQQPANSPCFVHSRLEKGADLNKIMKIKPYDVNSGDLGVAKSLQNAGSAGLETRFEDPPTPQHTHQFSPESTTSFASTSGYNEDDEDEYIDSLTTRLAETAVGVREMSKQLGRARVQSNIQNILIVTKARDNRLIKLTRELALYLMLKRGRGQQRGHVVYVDSQLRRSRRFDAEGIRRDHPELFLPFHRRRGSSTQHSPAANGIFSNFSEFHNRDEDGQLRYWTSSMCSRSPHLFDFVVTLGGDGTVLFTSWLFQKIVPPVLSFALGSLGFLTNFDFADHQAVMDSAIDNGIRVNLRMRFTCTVYRGVAYTKGKGRKAVKKAETGEIIMRNLEKGGGWEALEGGWSGVSSESKAGKDKEIMCYTTRASETFEVLNDLVVDRGPSPYVSQLELFGDDHHMTTVQADGLTVSTPTGSTAYSLSAGGSLVHPEIPAILITPICPHTLSFRPMLLPDSMELRICVPYNSRSTAWASFDGRGRVELKQGDHIKVTASRYPFPTVCADKQSTDWFHAISRTLKWNERERQKSFVVVEEGPAKPKRRKRSRAPGETLLKSPRIPDVDEDLEDDDDEGSSEDEDEEEDKFDIDDSSTHEDSDATMGMNSDDDNLLRPSNVIRRYRRNQSRSKSRSKSRARSVHSSRSAQSSRGSTNSSEASHHSGVDSPSRFASPNPFNQAASRMVDFSVSPPSSDSGLDNDAQIGMRDDLRETRSPSGRSRIPKDRDIGGETLTTPKTATVPLGRGRGHSVSKVVDGGAHRAFAVWGHDESDSNASDSDL